MNKKLRYAAAAVTAVLGLTVVSFAQPPADDIPIPLAVPGAETLIDTIGADSAAAAYECASWGCANTIYYWPSAGIGKYDVKDLWVSRTWPTSQSSVTDCTRMYAHRKNGGWYYVGRDCSQGDAHTTLYFDFSFEIDAVQIRSTDSRGRPRYMTIDGYSIAP